MHRLNFKMSPAEMRIFNIYEDGQPKQPETYQSVTAPLHVFTGTFTASLKPLWL